jgi:hypothetical protein
VQVILDGQSLDEAIVRGVEAGKTYKLDVQIP